MGRDRIGRAASPEGRARYTLINDIRRVYVKGRFWAIALLGIVVLLAGCGAPNPGPGEDVAVATASPSPTSPSPGTPVAVTSADDVRRISPAEARLFVDAGQAVMVDTRSAESYGSRHAAGAISLPESEAPGRLGELPTDKGLIFY
jgi:hypothetical protein